MRKNIILIIKEAVNNAVKHSNCKQIDIGLKKIGSEVQIQVEDDGIGFDTEKAKGNGLSNLKKRANELNGSLTIDSDKKLGTSIKVVFRLSHN